MTSKELKATYANGREARAFDIVEGKIDFAENPKNPFKAQVVRVLPKAGLAEIAYIRRPESMARRLPYFALQELAEIKAEIKRLEATTKTELAETKAELIKWVLGIAFAQTGLLVGVLKLHG
jgi:hypothetical protein